MLGLHRYQVAVVDPVSVWALQYQALAGEILEAATGIDLRLEHIGSTSVPGLAAKPIVDVGLLLSDPRAFPKLESVLSSIHLMYRGDKGSDGGRLFIRESAPDIRTHHVHVYFRGAPEWERYLIFRDRLRSSSALVMEYAALKRQLAWRYSSDPAAYMAGKTRFVAGVLADR